MYDHVDSLSKLNENLSLNEKLATIHSAIKARYPFINRLSMASYDRKTDALKTFLASNDRENALNYYLVPLSQAPSLQEILKQGRPRVINDLSIFANGNAEHTQRIQAEGYLASYTMPIYLNSMLGGFIFFNSFEKDCFNELVLQDLDIYGHLVANIVLNELAMIKTMLAALKTANDMIHYRDPETGGHLDRMSRFARLIAQELAKSNKYLFNDEYIEYIFLFAPMHDIGKIGIPDNVLLKPARLTNEEFEVMKTHTTKGRKLIDNLIDNFGLDSCQNIDILRNVAECHHEAIDGSGYPRGLKGNEIPVEARIIAVADIFDALASHRPYKQPWSNDEVFAMLSKMATNKLDQDCVAALIKNRDQVEQLQQQFIENPLAIE